ncbi:MarR family transcriptional regulator [Paenibacillus dokdonensis]|uniref:MarR family transcriptional regulator n=1 Tax=Paenibacillus dokdonensis TaxID=2567944 RepID=UPI00398ABC1B
MLSELDQLIGQLDVGVTPSQYYLLGAIQEKEPCSISSLAKKMDVTPSAITVMLDRLVQSKFVSRYHDEKDGSQLYPRMHPILGNK